jgi:hypothetical protein
LNTHQKARTTYLRAAYAVAKNSPAAWMDFVEAIKLYTASELERSLTTSASEAQTVLGMNRRLLEIRDDFIHIEERGGNGRGA